MPAERPLLLRLSRPDHALAFTLRAPEGASELVLLFERAGGLTLPAAADIAATVAAGDVFAAAAEAAERGLLTGTGYPETLVSERPRRRRLRLSWPLLGRRSTIAVVRLGRSAMLRGRAAEVAARLLRDAGKFAGVLLVVDSAGGDLSSADRAWTLLQALGRETPVVA